MHLGRDERERGPEPTFQANIHDINFVLHTYQTITESHRKENPEDRTKTGRWWAGGGRGCGWGAVGAFLFMGTGFQLCSGKGALEMVSVKVAQQHECT